MTYVPFHHLADRLCNRPLLITNEKAVALLSVLQQRGSIDGVLFKTPLDDADARVKNPVQSLAALAADNYGATPARERKPYPVIAGVAVIEVCGTLVNKLGLQPYSGMTGYDGIRSKLQHAMGDNDVHGVLFDIESGGGEVAGCFDLADDIRAVREEKPIWAIGTEYAYSAAYALASQCTRFAIPRTGGAGSVGVVCMHVDWSKFLENEGIGVTLIFSGEHKVDGNPYEALPDEVRQETKAEMDALRDLFAETVSAGRPGLSPEQVIQTQARTYRGQAAVDVGLVDAVAAPDEFFAEFAEHLARPV